MQTILTRWMTAIVLCLVGTAYGATAELKGTLRADQPGPVVSRYLFGQFAEHLGFGIYGGIWVGEESKILRRSPRRCTWTSSSRSTVR